jgi:hypothetical protein
MMIDSKEIICILLNSLIIFIVIFNPRNYIRYSFVSGGNGNLPCSYNFFSGVLFNDAVTCYDYVVSAKNERVSVKQ